MYAKLFSRIAQSSLMEEQVTTRYIFMMLIAIADRNGDVIGTDVAIARILNIPPSDFTVSIKPLLEPDPESNSQLHEGRRLIPCEIGRGYNVVNYPIYRDIKTEEEKREYMRKYMRERRNKENVKNVKKCKTLLSDVTHTEAEAEAEAEISLSAKASKEKRVAPILPFDDLDFHFFWGNWIQHRKEKKSPLTPTAMKQQLDRLREMGLERAIAAMKHSMANGWTGLFEPKSDQSNAAKRPQTYLERNPDKAHLAPTDPCPL